MKGNLLLDTNVIINHNRNERYMVSILQQFATYNWCICDVTYGEYVGAEKLRTKTRAKKALRPFEQLNFNQSCTKHLMRLAQQYEFPKHRLSDMMIAATALAYKMPLLTSNRKDFEGLKGLKLFVYSQP